ncbi:RNA-binding transcriptional accessory protein [Anaerosporomusa subterranea]|uniref:RNA-binding transcriptional accessory protein n=1 Tax=Anaerosporomusa subterranea TaxID=1794912 RepID=A0A154BLC1_ANASB|nr:Tex family protein [Anaerosporomusa subterranea]KYZ74763.1 RNA-binding transcriptional accessory protein [Anaerosporomusa subterranea]
MLLTDIHSHIAHELSIRPQQAEAAIRLLDEGNTVPFISRYRKEVTGELDEEKIRLIEERLLYLRNLVKRQEEIVASIGEQGKLTPELEAAILSTVKLQELEDLYLPYRPKKRTRAQIARERGLEPLADILLAQEITVGDPIEIALEFVNPEKEVETAEAALAGAMDIIAEAISERADFRAQLRKQLWNKAEIETELAVSEEAGKEVLTYKEYREPVSRMPSHRILAVNRGEKKELLKVRVVTPHELHIDTIVRQIITKPSIFKDLLLSAIADGYKRLLFPSLERELRSLLTENAEKQAIRVFGLNLKQLLLQPPLAGHTIMGLDPGFRTGCKLAIISPTGAILDTSVIYITHSEGQRQRAAETVLAAIRRHGVTLISIGNGTASFETEEFIASLINENNLPVHYLITNEAGASIYSASKLAKDELPDLDLTLRSAASIARRVQDPLAELVKIDPKSIGVGQYQHDVDQKELSGTLTQVVESAVNHVGVELNTASAALLTYVAGVSASVAKNIVTYRDAAGRFRSRRELLKVPRLGPAAFTQCAGFLRLQKSENPLDNTPVHPESYSLAEAILKMFGFALADLQDKEKLQVLQQKLPTVDSAKLAAELAAGEPTVRDILSALAKPGRDPREDLPQPMTRKNVVKLSDILPGTLVKGTVHNVIDFGVFVDIGIKINGLIHRSELSDKPIRHPLDVVSVGDIIECVVLSVDEARGRIGLSLKQAKKNA